MKITTYLYIFILFIPFTLSQHIHDALWAFDDTLNDVMFTDDIIFDVTATSVTDCGGKCLNHVDNEFYCDVR